MLHRFRNANRNPVTPRALLSVSLLLVVTGCVFKPEVRDGNFLDDKMIAQVKPGMTVIQVQYIMGRPMVTDPFHPDRWDYVMYVNLNDGSPIQERHVIAWFKEGKLDHLDEQPAKPVG